MLTIHLLLPLAGKGEISSECFLLLYDDNLISCLLFQNFAVPTLFYDLFCCRTMYNLKLFTFSVVHDTLPWSFIHHRLCIVLPIMDMINHFIYVFIIITQLLHA